MDNGGQYRAERHDHGYGSWIVSHPNGEAIYVWGEPLADKVADALNSLAETQAELERVSKERDESRRSVDWFHDHACCNLCGAVHSAPRTCSYCGGDPLTDVVALIDPAQPTKEQTHG